MRHQTTQAKLRRVGLLAISILSAGLLLLLPGFAPAAAPAATSTVTLSDPTDDVGTKIPGYLDIVSASVTGGTTGNISFNISVASSIPASPPLPGGVHIMVWFYCLSLNSSWSVGGWPLSGNANGTGHHDYCQFFLALYWDGTNFAGVAINRTAMLKGGNPVITAVPFNVSGSTIRWDVGRPLIGSPQSFGFFVNTELHKSPEVEILSPTDVIPLAGDGGYISVDPDFGPGGALVAWP